LQRLVRQTKKSETPPVLDQVRTKEGYERAIAAALGDDLQASTNTSDALYWAGAKLHRAKLPKGVVPLSELTSGTPARSKACLQRRIFMALGRICTNPESSRFSCGAT